MARQRIVLEGDEQLKELLEDILLGLDDFREAGTGAAALVAQRAYDQAPRRSGTLAEDIRTFATKRNAGMRVGRKRIPYAGPIVGGHGSRSATRLQGGYVLPNPFPFDALDDRRAAIEGTYHAFIDDLTNGRLPKAEHRYRLHTYE